MKSSSPLPSAFLSAWDTRSSGRIRAMMDWMRASAFGPICSAGSSSSRRQGFELLERLQPEQRVVIMVRGTGDIPLAVEAMRRGAENFLTKPVELPHLGVAAERALEKARLRELNRHLLERRGARSTALLGPSPAMRELAHQIELLATAERTTVLLTGETGTGKGRVAEAIHASSPRASRPFIELSCAGLSVAALEAELFGHEAGSSASVKERKLGLFEVADGGTLFLDEIGPSTRGSSQAAQGHGGKVLSPDRRAQEITSMSGDRGDQPDLASEV